jgi:hypothetical protein
MWGTLKIWTMSSRVSSAPTKGYMGCVGQKKGKKVAKGDDKKVM